MEGEEVDASETLNVSQINLSEAGPVTGDINQDEVFKDPSSFDFLESLKIKSTGRDFSKESFYTKFDPLVKPNTPNKNQCEVVDNLISLTPQKQLVNVVTPLKKEMAGNSKLPSKEDLHKLSGLDHSLLESELTKLHEMLLKQEKASQDKVTSYEEKINLLSNQVTQLTEKLKQSEEKEVNLTKKLNEHTQSQLQLNIVMQEYERLISKLTAEIENDKKSTQDKMEALVNDKESALTHLNNVEAAFSDVHEKYEKSKKVIEDYRKNEMKMRGIINEQIETIKTKEKQLDTVQRNCSSQVETLHKQLDHMKMMHEQELTRIRALLRKTELKVITLQESLDQKIKENQELTIICDDLIAARVPSQH